MTDILHQEQQTTAHWTCQNSHLSMPATTTIVAPSAGPCSVALPPPWCPPKRYLIHGAPPPRSLQPLFCFSPCSPSPSPPYPYSPDPCPSLSHNLSPRHFFFTTPSPSPSLCPVSALCLPLSLSSASPAHNTRFCRTEPPHRQTAIPAYLSLIPNILAFISTIVAVHSLASYLIPFSPWYCIILFETWIIFGFHQTEHLVPHLDVSLHPPGLELQRPSLHSILHHVAKHLTPHLTSDASTLASSLHRHRFSWCFSC